MTCTVRNNLRRVRCVALLPSSGSGTIQIMKRRIFTHSRKASLLCSLLLLLDAPRTLMGDPTPGATAAFDTYSAAVEARLVQQHQSAGSFLAPYGTDAKKAEEHLRNGEPTIERVSEQITPQAKRELSGAMLHHWRGTAFIRGAKAADFERLLRDFNSYPQHFSPQVLQAKVFAQHGDHMRARMRIRQRHVITVVMDTTCDVTFGQLDISHGYSISRSTRVDEIASPGTRNEHPLGPSEEHGFLWRLNTYWSYEERDGGLYLQIEAVSLTRSIPSGLGWAIGPYVESIPRESLEFTLNSASKALHK